MGDSSARAPVVDVIRELLERSVKSPLRRVQLAEIAAQLRLELVACAETWRVSS
jgi:hypothetical protein